MRKMFTVLILVLIATLFAIPVSAGGPCKFLIPETNYSETVEERSWSHVHYVYPKNGNLYLGKTKMKETQEGGANWKSRISVPRYTQEIRITRYTRSNRKTYTSYIDYWDVSELCNMASTHTRNYRLGSMSDGEAHCTNGQDRGGSYDGSNGDSCYIAADLGDSSKWNTKP